MTFEKKFAEFKKELEKRNASELPTDLAMQVIMTDEDCGGTFYIANICFTHATRSTYSL